MDYTNEYNIRLCLKGTSVSKFYTDTSLQPYILILYVVIMIQYKPIIITIVHNNCYNWMILHLLYNELYRLIIILFASTKLLISLLIRKLSLRETSIKNLFLNLQNDCEINVGFP